MPDVTIGLYGFVFIAFQITEHVGLDGHPEHISLYSVSMLAVINPSQLFQSVFLAGSIVLYA